MQIQKISSFLVFLFVVGLISGCGNSPSTTETSNVNSSSNSTGDQTGTTDDPPANTALSGTDCGEQALLVYNCWTSRFPTDATGKSDVTCSFLTSCCGQDVKNGWQTVYPEAAGLRGLVDSGSVSSSASCKTLDPLDVDADGTPNESDETPIGGEIGTETQNSIYPWARDPFEN